MTDLTQNPAAPAATTSAAGDLPARIARVAARALTRAAARLEFQARVRAKRQATRIADAQQHRLPERTRRDLRTGTDGVSALMIGLVGPPAYWRGHTRR
jgi:hypothetical protein